MADDLNVPKYINYAKVTASLQEFYLDLIVTYPDVNTPPGAKLPPQAAIGGRFVMSAFAAKQLMLLLAAQIEQLEENSGPIDPPPEPPNGIIFN